MIAGVFPKKVFNQGLHITFGGDVSLVSFNIEQSPPPCLFFFLNDNNFLKWPN